MKRVKQCVSVAFFMFLSLSAAAHPHSFISLQTEAVAENGQLTGFKMRWTMDEITSADLLYDAGNAKPGSEIWKKLAAEVMANVLGQHYFSELWHNGERVKFDNRPDGYGLERSGPSGGTLFYSAAGEAAASYRANLHLFHLRPNLLC